MQNFARALLLLGTATAAGAVLAADPVPAEEALARPQIDPAFVSFVETYCSECHNDFVEEGDRSFDSFLANPEDPAHTILVSEMLDALNHGSMPKQRPGEDIAMPSDEERRFAVASLTNYLTALAALEDPAETPLRRLTNNEYRNTVRDLLGVHIDSSEAAGSLPADNNVHGLENIAAEQNLSRQQLASYVTAAQEYLDAAFKPVLDPLPAAQRLIIQPGDLQFQNATMGVQLTRQTWGLYDKGGKWIDIGWGEPEERRPNFPKSLIKSGGVPADGIYAIRVTAEAIDRVGDLGGPTRRYRNEPLKLAVGFTPDPSKTQVVHAAERPVLEVFDLEDNKPNTYEIQTSLRKGSVPMVFWPNGIRGSGYIARIIQEKYPKYAKYTDDKFRFNPQGNKITPDLASFLYDDFKGPRVRIHGMEVIGPFPNEVKGAFSTEDFARFAKTPRGKLDDVFVEFASRAFRRPVTKAETAPYLALANKRLENGGSQVDALKLGFAAVMSSPRFLFLNEGNSEEAQALDNFELASRLSYFMWSTLPDQELLDLAKAGTLTQPAVLSGQVKRMIADKRASSFVSGFTNAWLRLDKLGSMPPDQKVRPDYFLDRLESAMRKETELVFAEVLFANRKPELFLDSDFTYLNGGLAKLYGMDGDFGENFSRVSLPDGAPRRGLIGHASILTASANGIDTSPVIRGVWVLENLIGTPPPAPPPDVPAVEPDARGATTIRQLLDKHRNVQACRDCHLNIDPYGYPLEVFGPIGELRSKYPAEINGRIQLNKGAAVEKDTVLPNGQEVNDLNAFRSHLLARKDVFRRHLVEKLLMYGTGREPTYRDHSEIERILTELEKQDGGMQDMLFKVATSKYFVSR